MHKPLQHLCYINNEKGAVLIWVTLGIVMFLGITALSIDVGHLYGVRNELQNGGDAGALAGASKLYDDNGLLTPIAADKEATKVATENTTGNTLVTVEDVWVGHWAMDPDHKDSITWYDPYTFTDVHSGDPNWWVSISASDLDNDPDFINAVKVVTRRSDTPSFFARIFNHSQFLVSSDSVAYISFAGDDVVADLPIGVCLQSITDPLDGSYNCTRGRMLNSGSTETHESAGWLDLDQNEPPECTGAAGPNDIRDDICSGEVHLVKTGPIDATGGTVDNVVRDTKDCWMSIDETGAIDPGPDGVLGTDDDVDLPDGFPDLDNICPGPDGVLGTEDDLPRDGIPDRPWSVTLPVINCETNNVSPCSMVVGNVEVKILWINRNEDPQFNDVPRCMYDEETNISYYCADDSTQESRMACWNDFVEKFNLQNSQETAADYLSKTIYFLPSCDVHLPEGKPTGYNLGILSDIPVLVE